MSDTETSDTVDGQEMYEALLQAIEDQDINEVRARTTGRFSAQKRCG